MSYYFPFGQKVCPLVQEDRTPKKAFVLGVYASAVHARWVKDGGEICPALAVASEPRIFWDGNPEEARRIIDAISIPEELGTLEPAERGLNGPSAKVLEENILAPLGYTREDVWLCDCLPETRLNQNQAKRIREDYDPLIETYQLNQVTIPKPPTRFCDLNRSKEITEELMESGAELLILLGDIPIKQYLKKVAKVPYSSLREYVELYGYGIPSETIINERRIQVLPFAHPKLVGALGAHSKKWHLIHKEWEKSRR